MLNASISSVNSNFDLKNTQFYIANVLITLHFNDNNILLFFYLRFDILTYIACIANKINNSIKGEQKNCKSERVENIQVIA